MHIYCGIVDMKMHVICNNVMLHQSLRVNIHNFITWNLGSYSSFFILPFHILSHKSDDWNGCSVVMMSYFTYFNVSAKLVRIKLNTTSIHVSYINYINLEDVVILVTT